MEPLRASPSVITRSTMRSTAAGSGASVRSPRPSARIASAIAACAHLAAEPCSPCALTSPARTCARNSAGVAAGGRLRPGAADVDAGVVVAAADADAAVGLDVDRGRVVELARARAVADLPDRRTAARAGGGGAAAAAPRPRRRDGPARTRSRARAGTSAIDLDVVRVRLQPVVVVGRDPVTEHVHGLRLAAEARGQLLGHEDVRPVRDLQHAGDRVVVGDRHEVHPAALGQGVDLFGRRGALRQAERALDAELRHLRRRRVAVQVRTAAVHVSGESSPTCRHFVTKQRSTRDRSVNIRRQTPRSVEAGWPWTSGCACGRAPPRTSSSSSPRACSRRRRSTTRSTRRERGERRARRAAPRDRHRRPRGVHAPGWCCPGSRGSVHRARRAPRAAGRPGRPLAPARRRPRRTPGRTARRTCSSVGGIPQGDYAPVPWVTGLGAAGRRGSRPTGTACASTSATRSCSRRAAPPGPLRVHLFTHRDAVRAPARVPAADRDAGAAAGVGLRALEEPRRLPHQRDAEADYEGYREHGIPLDAIVLDSPWATQYNTWEFNPHQFPDAAGILARLRADGVRTVVWVAPWVNLDSRDGQYPPDEESAAAARDAGAQLRAGALRARRRRRAVRDPLVDGHRLAGRLHVGRGRGVVARAGQARAGARRDRASRPTTARAGTCPTTCASPTARPARSRRGATGCATAARCSGRWTRCIPARACCSGGRAGRASRRSGMTWGGDQPSDFWSLRTLVAATLTAAASGFSNWSHDVGGYLGERLVSRCPKELLLRWVQFGCFTPLMHAHGRFEQEPWTYDEETLEVVPRATCCCTSGSCPTCAPRRRPPRAAGCRSSARSR